MHCRGGLPRCRALHFDEAKKGKGCLFNDSDSNKLENELYAARCDASSTGYTADFFPKIQTPKHNRQEAIMTDTK